MRQISISDLPTGVTLLHPLYHGGGQLLHSKGDVLTPENFDLMRKAGIQSVYELGPEDWLEGFLFQCRSEAVPVKDLEVGSTLTHPLSNDKGVLLLERGVKVTEGIKRGLMSRGYENLYRERTPEERRLHEADAYLSMVRRELVKPFKLEDLRFTERDLIQSEADISLATIERQLQDLDLNVKPSGAPLHKELRRADKTRTRSEKELARAFSVYQACLGQVEKMMHMLKENQSFSGTRVGDMCREIIGLLIDDKELLLNFTNLAWQRAYLPSHSTNTAILAMNIATALGYSAPQVLEIGYGALLHDIGMLWVPEEIVNKKGRLTPYERIEVSKHPYHAVTMLRRIRGLPTGVPLIVFQVHERLDGGGYPRRNSEEKIHRFSKMITVADIYEALTKPRPFRAAYKPYDAMRLTLQMVYRKEIDADSVRAFLQYVSLYPIGSFVRLSDERVGKVIGANEEDYTRPLVRVMWQGDQPLPAHQVVDLYRDQTVHIVEALRNADTSEALFEGF
ncbi:MAG: HD-GYP domain-containing protein [Nitrospirae bacterium]|nr:HD-GYP domain-containing protein [Nitrospirota bacterium]